MLKFIKYWLWDIEASPDRIGPIGYAIIGTFLAFCLVVLLLHETHVIGRG